MSITKSVFLKSYSSMKKNLEKLGHRKLTLKVGILSFSTTFTELTARLKNFLSGWRLPLGLIECATVCIKSEAYL